MTHGFVTPLRVENIDECYWLITEDFVWIGTRDRPDVFTVPKGDRTDFATVPWWTQSLLPRTGTWTKAAVLHDRMCNDLNNYYKLKKEYDNLISSGGRSHHFVEPVKPRFTSIDTDAIFRLNARECGTDFVRSELLWFGVRCGAMSRARREDWWHTFPRWFVDLIVILVTLFVFGTIISVIWPW